MSKKFSIVGVVLLVFFGLILNSCNKDINVNADWQNIPVVFGLLDQNADTQFVKINKAFLGKADAFDMAQVRDSSEYENVDAVVEEWKDGELKKTYTLSEYEVTDKEEGVFYAPNQTVYYFVPSRLDSLASYKLVATVNPGTGTETTVTATTEIIDDVRFGGSYLRWTDQGSAKLSIDFASSTEILDQNFVLLPQPDAKRFEIYGIFQYYDVLDLGGGDTAMRLQSFEYKIADKKALNTDGTGELTVSISGEQFFQLVGDNVPPIEDVDEPILRRIVGDGSYLIKTVVAGDELNTYMEVNEPSSGIVQEKKEYTNVENGIGVFSTRTSTIGSLKLSQNTIKELMYGEITSSLSGTGEGYTIGRKFCNNDIATTFCESCNSTDPCW